MTVTLRLLGDLFQSEVLYAFQLIMTGFVCCAYTIAMSCTILAFCKGKIVISSPSQVMSEEWRNKAGRDKEDGVPPFAQN